MNKSRASLGRPLPDATLPRNPFDRSKSVTFNTKLGYLDPVFCESVPAGSHFELNRSEFLRCADVRTAAMLPFDHYVDFYAVPLNLLFTDWDNWFLNIRDSNTSFQTNLAYPNGLPAQRETMYAMQVAMMLNILDGAAEDDNLPLPGTGEFARTGVTIDKIYLSNARRLLNRLKYGVSYCPNASDIYVNISADDYGYIHDPSNQFQNLFKLLAYQKVYFDHYRNSSYESQNPFYFNIDWIKDNNPDSDALMYGLGHWCNLRSVNFRKDFFQSVYPALNYVPVENVVAGFQVPNNIVNAFGTLETNLATGDDKGRWLPNDPLYARVQDGNVVLKRTSQYSNLVGSTAVDGSNVTNMSHTHLVNQLISPDAYNVQAIRAAFALDKLKRASAYAPRHVKDQYEARFGFKYKGVTGHSVRLGSFHTEFNLHEVVQTTPTDTSQLGTIGGRGLAGSGFSDTIKYDSNCETLIIGLSYFVPRIMYDSFRLDPWNCKYRRNDFIQPEFMDLGLQPLYHKFLACADVSSANDADTANNRLIGYQDRYQEYKTQVSENYGLFENGNQLSIFTTRFHTRNRLYNTDGVNSRFFKILPSDADDIFTQNADTTELTDQFFGIINFRWLCNQNLSIHGQPKL